MIIKYEDYLLEKYNYKLINENYDLKTFFDKINNISLETKKKIVLCALLGAISYKGVNYLNSSLSNIKMDSETKMLVDTFKKDINNWKLGSKFTLSQDGWNHIRNEEKFKEKAYSIGDGKITIGWGHAEDENKSKFKIGQKITKDEANKLLYTDLKEAADGVRRIFKEWESKGIKIYLTQNMFDSLVSMAYNMGIGNLRQSKMIQHLKKANYKKAGDEILNTSILSNFPGLKERRKKEREMFLSI